MTTDELNTLSDLAAQFKARADTAERMRDKYHRDASYLAAADLNQDVLVKNAERLEGKRQAYANDADDLERFIRTFTPTAARAGGE